MIAVLKAGGAFVPLDPMHPESRLQFLIQSVKAQLILCTPCYRDKLCSASAASVIAVDESLLEECSEANISCTVNGSNAAYVMFTSGSTGQPKV
jgi:non-ribosomal peptide synthetase component F